MAFTTKLSRGGQTVRQIVWSDATKGAGRAGRRWADCRNGDHRAALDAAALKPAERAALAGGARTAPLREKLRRCYESLERERARDAARAGGYGKGSRFETLLVDLIHDYLDDVAKKVDVRAERGGREGRAPTTLSNCREAADKLVRFLTATRRAHITTGEVTGAEMRQFRDWLVQCRAARTDRILSAGTVNKTMRAVKAIINRYADDEDPRPYFRVTARSLCKGLAPVPQSADLPEHFPPETLQRLLDAALMLDERDAVVVERRKRHSKRIERYEQPVKRTALHPWVALLMLTGCRVHEAAGLRWVDVDLQNAWINLRSRKTGRVRRLFLDDSAHRVSPGLLALLKRWRFDAPDAEFVLPANGRSGQPTFPKHPWDVLCREANVHVRAKALRSNWVSYMASLGRPAAVVALMAGHSPLVLEKHYLSYTHARLPGDSLDDAMGVRGVLGVDVPRDSLRLASTKNLAV